MKKSVALLVLLLCVLLLCSCGNTKDKDDTPSETQNVTAANTDGHDTAEAESTPADNSTNAADVKTAAAPDAATVSGAGNKEEKSSSATGGEVSDAGTATENGGDTQTPDSSDEPADATFYADEYELPFIPN